MKILQIITSLRTGGAERLVADLAGRMAGAGNDVTVLLFDGSRTPLLDELEGSGISVRALGKGVNAMHNPLLVFRLSAFLRNNRFDIIHTHNTPCQLITALCPAARMSALVTTEHNTSNRRRGNNLLKPLDRWMYGRYRSIICVGEETARNLKSWLPGAGLESRITVIPNGIDLNRIRNAEPAPDIAALPGTKILMVSAFRPQKDQLSLVKAMQYLPETYSLFLAGGAELPEHRILMAQCRDTAASLGVEDRVFFLGIRRDVPELLAAADIIVLSTHHEGMPLSLLEAMASGKPVLASDVKGVREFAASQEALFPEGDAKKIADKISFVTKNHEISRLIKIGGSERAGQFDIALTASAYRKLYTWILNN